MFQADTTDPTVLCWAAINWRIFGDRINSSS